MSEAELADMGASAEDSLEEIAEDMLDLLQRTRSIEEQQSEMMERLTRLDAAVADGAAATGRALHALRRDLLEDASARATRHVFGAVVPVLDTQRSLLAALDAADDARTWRQVRAVVSSLSNLLQNLGFEAFEAAEGEPFDPHRMECLGFEEGEPGIVLQAVRSGYRIDQTVVRPAGVRIADARADAATQWPSKEDDPS